MQTAIPSETTIRFGEFELNLLTRELYRDGSRLKIRGHPIDVLAILLEHPGELVTREMLHKRLWPDNTFVDFEQILNNSVGKLRDALGDKAESPRFIETLPRLGYRFIATVERATTAPDQAAQVSPDATPHPSVPLPTLPARKSGIFRPGIVWPAIAFGVFTIFGYSYLRTPLPAPHIAHYEQLTLDGRRKTVRGTDGTRIYLDLIGPGRGIAQIPVSGGRVTELPVDSPPGADSWLTGVSPDGSSLLAINKSVGEDAFKVWVLGALGHPARYLTRAISYSAAWSPDGKTVVYADAHGDLYTINISGGESRLLHRESAPASQLTRIRDASWSPDGGTIRFTRWGGRIFEISSTGENLHEWLPGWNGSIQKCCGRWTPDGRFYLFLAGGTLVKAPTSRSLAQIWAVDERRRSMRPHRGEPVLLASGPMLWGNPVPSLDGKKIFARGVSLRGELERYNTASKRLEAYLNGISAEMLSFSRDGKYIAYVSFPDGILWRANRDGSGLMQLTEAPFHPRDPRWSPDGAEILFTDNTQNGVDAIYVVSSQGGMPRRFLPHESGPHGLADWSPDGTRVVYSTFGVFSFVPAWDLGRVETRIVELGSGRSNALPERPGGFFAPHWSPDGRYIAGYGRYTAGRYFDGGELLIFDTKTGVWNAVIQNDEVDFPSWSHDGRFLYFVRWVKRRVGVYRVAARGGKTELVFDLPDDFRGTGWYDFWMSLDPADAPLILRDAGTDEIYALTLEVK